MNAISTFTFHESHQIRTVLINKDVWFIAKDVFETLAITWNGAKTLLIIPDAWRLVVKLTTKLKNQHGSFAERTNDTHVINFKAVCKIAFRSNKPEADNFTNWAAEVIEQVLKTGKYEVPKPVAPSNYVTANDMENIKRLVWHCSDFMDYDETFSRAVWYALREKTGVKSPEAFKVEDLPLLGEEFERIIHIIEPYLCARREAERQLISRLVRGRGDYETIMKDILYLMRDSVEEQTKNTRKKIDGLFKRDFTALIERKTMTC